MIAPGNAAREMAEAPGLVRAEWRPGLPIWCNSRICGSPGS